MVIVHTKLWVDIEQGKDEGEFLIFLLSEEGYEADKVVEQKGSQHRPSHLRMSSVEKLGDHLNVGDGVEGWKDNT